jgi:hypothetical protein
MKTAHFAALGAALALMACGQAEAPKEEAPPAPQTMIEQVLAMRPEQQQVFAYQQLIAYQQVHPEAQPTCTAVRATEARGIIPENISPDSVYAQFVGASVYSVQCGPQLSATRFDPREHWVVAFMPGASEATVINCADARGLDICTREVPTVAAPTPAASTTP